MEKVRYHEMLPHEIVARRSKCPGAFLGLGGLEWHGEHQAVGLDALKAEKLCEMAAERSGGFAFPTLWYGDPRAHAFMESDVDVDGKIKSKMKFKKSRFTKRFWGKSADEQVEFFQSLLMHVLMQLHSLEMKAVCILTGLYRFENTGGDEPEYGGNKRIAGGDHAAKWETSYLWYLRPDCVDMSVYNGREDEPLIGVRGEDPRKHATIELGRRGCKAIVDGMVGKAAELLKAAGHKA